MEEFQSGFRSHHNTETALIEILSDIRVDYDKNKPSILILCAAFDAIDHNFLIKCLQNVVGLSDCPELVQNIHQREKCLSVMEATQGNCLGPLLFPLYMLQLGDIIRKHNACFHSYADDTQLYLSAEPKDAAAIDAITKCLFAINTWISSNFLKLKKLG